MAMLPLSQHFMQPIPRLEDGDTFTMVWSGGLQAAEIAKDNWRILPVLHAAKPHVNGTYTRAGVKAFMLQRGVRFVAFQRTSVTNGAWGASWSPYIPGETNFFRSPADLWNSVAKNLSRVRTDPLIAALQSPAREDIAAIIDAQDGSERLARSISLSLRSLDTSVGQIASFYQEELTNLLAAGRIDGLGHASTRDQSLYVQIHSFFLHLGAVRDYVGAFIAIQLALDPESTNSMAKLIGTLRGPDTKDLGSPVLQIFESKGYLRPKGAPSTKWKAAGWLEQATDLRNELVHRRTYGHKTAEKMGHLRPVDRDSGLYRYFRPLVWGTAEKDVFDIVLDHYEQMNELLFALAHASGHDLSIVHITDDDVISMERTSQ